MIKLKQHLNNFLKHCGEEFCFVLFIASLVFIIHHHTHIFKPFDSASLHLNTAVLNKDKPSETSNIYRGPFVWMELENYEKNTNSPVLLTYDQNLYDSTFMGISPLDRCTLNDHLLDILKLKPKVLAIDIDMSPLKFPNEKYLSCQSKLDQTLDKYADKLVLIYPVHNIKMERDSKTEAWMKARQANGVVFANPTIESSLGIVLNRSPYSNSVANCAISKAGHENGHEKINESKAEHGSPINYLSAKSFSSINQSGSASITDRPVFLGGTYGIDDFYLTPIGEKIPGVMIHALDFFSISNPVSAHGFTNIIAYLLDVCVAFTVGFIMNKSWQMALNEIKKNSEMSFVYFGAIIIILAIISFIGILLSALLLKFNIWISPIPILIAIFFDGVIKALVDKSLNNGENSENSHHKHDKCNLCSLISIIKNTIIRNNKTPAHNISWSDYKKCSLINIVKIIIMGVVIIWSLYLMFVGLVNHN